jgi:hypothetical protein
MLKCQIWLLGGADNQCQFGVTILYLILLFPGYSEPSAKKAFMMDLSRKYTQTFSNVVPTVCFEPSVYIYIFIICPDSLEFAITVRWRNWIGRTKLIHLYIYIHGMFVFHLGLQIYLIPTSQNYILLYIYRITISPSKGMAGFIFVGGKQILVGFPSHHVYT